MLFSLSIFVVKQCMITYLVLYSLWKWEDPYGRVRLIFLGTQSNT
jgi:hypothetical protein